MRVEVEKSGGKGWHIALLQDGLTVESGKTYTFRYRARGDDNYTIKSDVSDEWTIYTFEFEANQTLAPSDGGARVLFEFGLTEPGTIEIDDVEFFEGTLRASS